MCALLLCQLLFHNPFRQRIDEGPLFCFNFVVIRVRRRIEIKLPLVYLTHNTLYENAIERV